MSKLFRPLLAVALAATCSGLTAKEAGKLDAKFKFHAGITAGDIQEDLNRNKHFGVGAEVSYGMAGGAIFGEFIYNKYASEDFTPAMPAGAFQNPTGAGSVELRKWHLSGFSVRAGYRRALFADWNWQAGLTLDMLKNRQEVSLTYRNSGTTIIETAAATPETSKLSPGLFGGVHTELATGVSFELNLRTVGYDRVNYVTRTASGAAAPFLETTKRTGLACEIGLGFKF